MTTLNQAQQKLAAIKLDRWAIFEKCGATDHCVTSDDDNYFHFTDGSRLGQNEKGDYYEVL